MKNSNPTHSDEHWMYRAIELAKKGAGNVSPNPLVGCVVVDEKNNVIGEGYHKKIGQAHAEVNAIESIKDKSLKKCYRICYFNHAPTLERLHHAP